MADYGEGNLSPREFPRDLKWGSDADAKGSLAALYAHAVATTEDAIGWYFRDKKWKARGAQALRAGAVVLTTAGGIIPFVVAIDPLKWGESVHRLSQLGYILLALAGGCVLLDKFFGLTSAWTRFVVTATALQRILAEFQFDWATLSAGLAPTQPVTGAGRPPDGGGAAAAASMVPVTPPAEGGTPAAGASGPALSPTHEGMLRRLRAHVLRVREEVERETSEWAAEYRSGLTQIEQATRQQAEAWRPGVVNVTAQGCADLRDARVLLDNVEYAPLTGSTSQIRPVFPGPHLIAITGTRNGQPVTASTSVNLAPGQTVNVTLSA